MVMVISNVRIKGSMLHVANTILKDEGYLFLVVSLDYLFSMPYLLLIDP
jgi:hypothetical protein